MHWIPNLCFSLRINAMKPDLPVVYSLKGSYFGFLYVPSRIAIWNNVSYFKFTHFYIILNYYFLKKTCPLKLTEQP